MGQTGQELKLSIAFLALLGAFSHLPLCRSSTDIRELPM